MPDYYIRKARVQDVKAIHGLLLECFKQGLVLPRSYNELYNHLRDVFVVVPPDKGPVVGCGALSITWEDLAEVRSLVVTESLRRKGWGQKLVEACLSEAVTLGIYRVFALTYQTTFFSRQGFVEVSKDTLPQKVWTDCVRCPKFPECDETAMLIEM